MERVGQYRRNHPEKVNEWMDNRRRLEWNSKGSHTYEDWNFIKK